MRDLKNLQIAIICLVIVVIGLIVTLIMMNQGNDERLAREKKAQDDAKVATDKATGFAKDLLTLKQFVGLKEDSSAEDVQNSYNDAMNRYAKNTDDASKNYLTVLRNLAAELATEKDTHKKTQDEKLDLETRFNNLNTLYNTVLNKSETEKEKAVTDLQTARKDFEENLTTLRTEIATVKADADGKVAAAEENLKLAQKEAEDATVETKQVKLVNEDIAKTLDDLRRTGFERPDGKITSVNQTSSIVIVNLGSEDGLMTRMTFSVYDPTITGISFGEHDPDHDVQICDVCKRDMAQSASKASIEITKILGPHQAEGRILDDLLTDPIVKGDVIYTPVWKPGQRQHFALAAGLRIPGVGSRDGSSESSDLNEIIRLIRANGGEVDCYISESGDNIGEVVGKITRDTTFLILGELNDEDNQNQKAMASQNEMITLADQYAVRKMTLREFLARMGWKNVTPVRGFGSRLTDSDIAIAPSGKPTLSTGQASSLYQPFNAQGRIGMEDRGGIRSTGRVSDLYNKSAVPTTSTGRTSDLFRPRKPVTSELEIP